MMEHWRRDAIKARNAAVVDVPCPDCGAAVGEKCKRWQDGEPAQKPCFARIAKSPAATKAVQDALAPYRLAFDGES